ncbi:hypothetical protein LTR66_011622 [Elasticomyces elasticus]|nr:hypothetical protein LTR66_011622 [Elasticomyces elasticus]
MTASEPPAYSDDPTLQTQVESSLFGNLFVLDGPRKKTDKEEDKKIKAVLARLHKIGLTSFTEANVEYALRSRSAGGDSDEAFRLLLLLEHTREGLVKPYNPQTKLLGAENREGVTCYLDALLFAMFARLDSFEAMLYEIFEDAPRKRLAGVLRLWVNMLRTGKLITVDITKHLQEALATCGWQAAAQLSQQDASEAFSFITGQLELPLLTLKMDIFHTGKEDPTDDHKFINERLLEVAIIEQPPEGSKVVTLEHCLENYFNNRVEVKRHLEFQRRNTLQHVKSSEKGFAEKLSSMHIETVEVSDEPESPYVESPNKPTTPVRPLSKRKRADSIFSQRRREAHDVEKPKLDDASSLSSGRPRKGSTRTEVLMPAFQFFKLLPWYTENAPTSDAQVAAHFSKKRPILGICLKRYSMSNTGVSKRLNTYIDIPTRIDLPTFLSDELMDDDEPLTGKFTLLLQSVVCHRGASVHSGHYISLVRGHASNAQNSSQTGARPDSPSSDDENDAWMRFDDLARDRVTYVDITQALQDESPYLLFYRVQPIDEYGNLDQPPSYDDAVSHTRPNAADTDGVELADTDESGTVPVEAALDNASNGADMTDPADWAPSTRNSLDANTILDDRGRTSISSHRRSSTTFDKTSAADSSRTETDSTSAPSTPLDESRTSFLQVASRRGSKVSSNKRPTKSRPSSQSGETSKFGLSMTKLASRLSRSDLPAVSAESPPPPPALAEQASVTCVPSEEPGRGRIGKERFAGGGSKEKGKSHHHHHHQHRAEHEKLKKSKHDDRDCCVM